MTDTHSEWLVSTQTEDGYSLEGVVFTPTERARNLAVVWMHGFTGRFYELHTVTIGRRLAERGYTFVSGNNRGHDAGAFVFNARSGESLLAGGWWEDFEACRFDYSAWIGLALEQGFSHVVLAGHSLGALKAVHYLGTHPDERVAALISASGPVRVGERMRDQSDRLALAQRMFDEGRGADLLPADRSGRVTSAQTLLGRARVNMDVYGLVSDDPPLARIGCPILFVLGSNEPDIGVKADLAVLQGNARAAARTQTLYVEGADHVYTGRAETVADGVGDWLDQLSATV